MFLLISLILWLMTFFQVQPIFDAQCPSNSVPLQSLSTQNPANGHTVQNGCISPSGLTFGTIARTDIFNLQANLGTSLVYLTPASGTYQAFCQVVLTQPATTSSTLPTCSVLWFDNDTGVASQFIITNVISSNAIGVNSSELGNPGNSTGSIFFNARSGTNISMLTSSYASSGATPMQYAVHLKIQYLGP